MTDFMVRRGKRGRTRGDRVMRITSFIEIEGSWEMKSNLLGFTALTLLLADGTCASSVANKVLVDGWVKMCGDKVLQVEV